MNETIFQTTDDDSLLMATDVARRLKISRATAYQLLQRGEIPTVRFGTMVRVRNKDLEEYIQRNWTGWKTTPRFE